MESYYLAIGAIQKMRIPPDSAVLRTSMTNNDVLGKNDDVTDDIYGGYVVSIRGTLCKARPV